jgi:hypothetical protein
MANGSTWLGEGVGRHGPWQTCVTQGGRAGTTEPAPVGPAGDAGPIKGSGWYKNRTPTLDASQPETLAAVEHGGLGHSCSSGRTDVAMHINSEASCSRHARDRDRPRSNSHSHSVRCFCVRYFFFPAESSYRSARRNRKPMDDVVLLQTCTSYRLPSCSPGREVLKNAQQRSCSPAAAAAKVTYYSPECAVYKLAF